MIQPPTTIQAAPSTPAPGPSAARAGRVPDFQATMDSARPTEPRSTAPRADDAPEPRPADPPPSARDERPRTQEDRPVAPKERPASPETRDEKPSAPEHPATPGQARPAAQDEVPHAPTGETEAPQTEEAIQAAAAALAAMAALVPPVPVQTQAVAAPQAPEVSALQASSAPAAIMSPATAGSGAMTPPAPPVPLTQAPVATPVTDGPHQAPTASPLKQEPVPPAAAPATPAPTPGTPVAPDPVPGPLAGSATAPAATPATGSMELPRGLSSTVVELPAPPLAPATVDTAAVQATMIPFQPEPPTGPKAPALRQPTVPREALQSAGLKPEAPAPAPAAPAQSAQATPVMPQPGTASQEDQDGALPREAKTPLHAPAPIQEAAQAAPAVPVAPRPVTGLAVGREVTSEPATEGPRPVREATASPIQPLLSTAGPRPAETILPTQRPATASWSQAQSVGAQMEGSIRWILRQGQSEAQMQLHPENLGKVTIQLRVEGQQVHARVWASEAATMPLLQEHKASLEVSLQQQGLSLGSFDLQHGAQQGRQAFEAPVHSSPFRPEPLPEQQEMPAALPSLSLLPSGIEVFA